MCMGRGGFSQVVASQAPRNDAPTVTGRQEELQILLILQK